MRRMAETRRLLDEARGGDRAALDELFGRHRGRLYAFTRSAMGGASRGSVAAEDVLQETLLEASRKLGSFEDRGPSSFYRWLVAIARFKVREADRARRAGKRAIESPLGDDPAARDTSPSGRAMRRERAEILRDALAALPGEQGEAVRLRYLEALPVADVAARIGKSEGAVKALVARGLASLAENREDSG